jgi:type IV pilus assembly protein PilV
MKSRPVKALKSYRGGSLIEVLISLVIISVAMLGIAALQAQSIAEQVSAMSRAKLAVLTADFSDRMRRNLSQAPVATQNNPASPFQLTTTWASQAAAPTVTPDFCNGLNLSPQQRAVCDVAIWRIKLRKEIPDGSAHITGNTQSGIKLTLMWSDKQFRTRPDLALSTEQLRSSPSCDEIGLPVSTIQNCCPSAAQVPEGVRCHTTFLLP